MFKKKNLTLSMICGALLAVSGGVLAGDSYYGANLASIDHYSELGPVATVTAIYGRLGTSWNDNFSGELRAGFGIADDTVEFLGKDVDLQLNHFLGAYIKGGAHVNEVFYPYGIIGVTRGEAEASLPGFSETKSETDVSFGLGADFNVSDLLTVNLEYMNYYDNNSAEFSGFSIGFTSSF